MAGVNPPRSAAAIRFGHYELIERIGAGGMAEVWRARAVEGEQRGRIVAVKRILPHLSASREMAELFLVEAERATRMRHPNIVETFEVGEIDGRLFLAMEYLNGADLGQLLRRNGAFPPFVAVHVVREICRALAYVHGLADELRGPLSLVHCDVSPSNIRLGDDGTVRLLDFGVARAVRELSHAADGSVRGKRGYIAPEVLHGEPASQHADQYALGVVLYELLHGARLLPGHETAELDRVARVPASLDPQQAALNAICVRALAADPAARFPTVSAMGDELDPVAVALGSTRSRSAAWLRRHDVSEPRDPVDGAGPLTVTDARFAQPEAVRRKGIGSVVAAALLVATVVAAAWTLRSRLWSPAERSATSAAALPVAPTSVPPPVEGTHAPSLLTAPKVSEPVRVAPSTPPDPPHERSRRRRAASARDLRHALEQRFP